MNKVAEEYDYIKEKLSERVQISNGISVTEKELIVRLIELSDHQNEYNKREIQTLNSLLELR